MITFERGSRRVKRKTSFRQQKLSLFLPRPGAVSRPHPKQRPLDRLPQLKAKPNNGMAGLPVNARAIIQPYLSLITYRIAYYTPHTKGCLKSIAPKQYLLSLLIEPDLCDEKKPAHITLTTRTDSQIGKRQIRPSIAQHRIAAEPGFKVRGGVQAHFKTYTRPHGSLLVAGFLEVLFSPASRRFNLMFVAVGLLVYILLFRFCNVFSAIIRPYDGLAFFGQCGFDVGKDGK